MTFNEYQKQALRTSSMGLGFATETAVRSLGLCGEAVELHEAVMDGTSVDAMIKEAGDVMWYGATLASAFDLTGESLGVIDLRAGVKGATAFMNPEGATLAISSYAGKLAEIVKKLVGHQKRPDIEKVKSFLQSILANLQSVLMWYGYSLDDAATRNVDKLKARYPDGFDVKIAAAKPDSGETNIIG